VRSVVPALPSRLRSLTPERLRDDVRLRALAVGSGLIPPRTMHSEKDARVLLEAAKGAKRVVEIGVYEGSSALALCETLGPGAELHLVDPFGSHPDALPSGWGATEWATRHVVSRALRRRAPDRPSVLWHIALSHEVATSWSGETDVVFIDGDHSEAGCELDWSCWYPLVSPGGRVVFHDARADQPDGRGLPGPTAVVARHFRSDDSTPGWEIAAEADRTVVVRRVA
jgi:predicted O-methyltransferase YrrM